tara:strand:+ start:132 stop:578 length:447 start_codon:yes stop_codon:yes gene_type:complete
LEIYYSINLSFVSYFTIQKKELFTQDGDDQKDTPSGSEINKNPDVWSLELEYHALKMKEILNKVLDGDYTGPEAGIEFKTELDNAISLKGKYEGPAQGSMYYSESPDISKPQEVANLASQIVVQTSELLRMILNPANRPINEKSILAA